MEYINASYSFTPTDSWGRVYSNGSWTGMVRKLIDREEDITGTGLFMNSLRQPYIHFIWRICKTRVIYIFRRPPLSYVSNIFTLSFQRNVWISSAMLAVLVIVLVYLTVAWEMKTTDTTAEVRSSPLAYSRLQIYRNFRMLQLYPYCNKNGRMSVYSFLEAFANKVSGQIRALKLQPSANLHPGLP